MIVRLIPLGSLFDNALINSINRRILIVVHHRAECLVCSYELHGKSSRLCEYISRFSSHSYKKYSALYDEDFRTWKRYIPTHYEWNIYVEKYSIKHRNVRELDRHFQKIYYGGFESIMCKGLQLQQQLAVRIWKAAPWWVSSGTSNYIKT